MNAKIKHHDFAKLIESIGFEYKNGFEYENYKILLYLYTYDVYDGSKWINNIPYTDLTIVNKISRSIKLKKILG